MGGAGGAVLNYETVDVVMPEAYSGPMGCAAIVNCVRSYPNDWYEFTVSAPLFASSTG